MTMPPKKILDPEQIMPVLEELLAQGQTVSLTVTGSSMAGRPGVRRRHPGLPEGTLDRPGASLLGVFPGAVAETSAPAALSAEILPRFLKNRRASSQYLSQCSVSRKRKTSPVSGLLLSPQGCPPCGVPFIAAGS